MNFIKATIATAAVITCCLGNDYPAKAQATCRHNEFYGTTTCSTPNGTITGRHNEFYGTTTWSGPGGSVTCRHNDFYNTTTCN